MTNRFIPFLIIILASLIVIFVCLIVSKDQRVPAIDPVVVDNKIVIDYDMDMLGDLYDEIEIYKQTVIRSNEIAYTDEKHRLISSYIQMQIQIVSMGYTDENIIDKK